MLDAVPTHIKFIEGNNIFRKVVANAVIRTELTVDCFFRCQQIGDLNIQLFAALVTYKINFLIACFADGYRIAAAQQFEIYNIFKAKRTTMLSLLPQLSDRDVADRGASAEEQYNYTELNALLMQGISKMPPQRQLIFRMSRYEHLSNREIAERLGLSVRTVDKHIELALKDLHSTLC